jgi:hypothetical protein
LERRRQIDAMLLEHLDGQVWVKLLDRAQAAAKAKAASNSSDFPVTSAATVVAKST